MRKLFIALQTRITELRDRQEGQAYVEYGVLLALVAIALIATVLLLSGAIDGAFDNITKAIDDKL
jgi:Flp pilus assembly pilin Flp